MKVTLIRHGETEENKEDILQGHLPGELSELGISQAEDVADELKDKDVDLIISSDLARAYDTAKEISKFHDGITVEKSKLLRERSFGDLEGKSTSEINIPENSSFANHVKNNNGETKKELFDRARKILDLIEKKPEEEIILVSHCGIMKQILNNILDKNPEDAKDIEIENASITSLEFDDDEWSIIERNNTDHLEDESDSEEEKK